MSNPVPPASLKYARKSSEELLVLYGISKSVHRRSTPPRMQEATRKSTLDPANPGAARDAPETLETLGAADETVAAAAITGELASFSATAAGDDRGVRFASAVVIKKP